ncbi:hypothetical protein Tco_1352716 [Tanacetum coccineum]
MAFIVVSVRSTSSPLTATPVAPTSRGPTLIFATLEDLDLGLLGDVISEDDCGDDGEDENVFIIGERCNLGWTNIVKVTSPRDV